jgi:hypothetical protein
MSTRRQMPSLGNERAKHTPGRWTVGVVWSQTNGASYSIAEDDGDEGGEEMQANRHLISAAPDLLDAVKVLMEDYARAEGCYCGELIGGTDREGLPKGACGFCLARAAIAKAGGAS